MTRRYETETERLQVYCDERSKSLRKQLGFGQDGLVYVTDVRTAVKALNREALFTRERDIYQRLKDRV